MLFFSEPRRRIHNQAQPQKGTKKGTPKRGQNVPRMHPFCLPQEAPKPLHFLVFSLKTGPRRGPVFSSKMIPGMIQNRLRNEPKMGQNRYWICPDLMKNSNLINKVPLLFLSGARDRLINKINLIIINPIEKIFDI